MTTLAQQLEDEFGSQMAIGLYFDFPIIEAATWYLKKHQRSYSKSQIKKILNQFINKHATNQLDPQNNPVGEKVDYCFDAWWKDQPSPRSWEQQQKETENQYYETSVEDPIQRVQRVQDEIELNEQMYGHNENEPTMDGFKVDNPMLTSKLLSTPKIMHTVFNATFRNVTSGQLPEKLEEAGILDKSMRNRVMKHLLSLCNNAKSVMQLTDNELPLSTGDVAHWIVDRVDHKAVYMQDSKTWYYQRDNKYTSTPDCHTGEPVHNALEDYYDLCSDYEDEFPLFSQTISKTTDRLQMYTQSLYHLIGTVETHTESEFNENVLTEGRFCTPNGLYDYTHKISDNNGLTKVTTKANILNWTNKEIMSSEGVRLFGDFMNSIQPNPAIRDYLIGVIANAITGHRENEYTYIFHGPTGANGKSVLMALLQHMLGGYYSDYNTDSLVRHSYGETAEQAAKNLENRRLVGGREIGDGSTIDGGAFKRYFSNDSYTINEKYKPAYTVKPTHTMFLPVNQMPNFGSDPAVKRRLVVIPFTQHFVDNPTRPNEQKKDPKILEQLIAHEDEIFTYLIQYAEILRSENIMLTIPRSVQHYGDDMVDENNVLADFEDQQSMVLSEETLNDPTVPTPLTSGNELFERYLMSLSQGAYNPYKTRKSFVRALLLKYPQLKSVTARATDGKVYRAIRGIWLKPNTTAALKLDKSRVDENGMIISFPTFKASLEYQDWLLKQQQ